MYKKIGYLNDNHFGFTPQKSTTDAAMAVKQFIESELERGREDHHGQLRRQRSI